MIECENNLIKIDSLVIKCPEDIQFYIELQDKIIVLVLFPSEIYNYTKKGFRNIFCYDKKTGEELWQVESKESSPYVEVGVDFPGLKEEDIECKQIKCNEQIIGLEIPQRIRKGTDRLEARTFSCYKYYIDIESGKVECFGYTK